MPLPVVPPRSPRCGVRRRRTASTTAGRHERLAASTVAGPMRLAGLVVVAGFALFPTLGTAQSVAPPTAPDVDGRPADAPDAPDAPSPAPPAPPDAAKLDKVEITGGRADDVQERRRSTAAKIVIGRDEIERFGDSTLGEVLKRLPGVTLQGRPGRGGAIRMRGLGSGYTQILLDGERVPAGFSIDSLAPEQIERIEVIRAPTAETGARAIAGTINIVTRGGYTKRVNDLRLSAATENGRAQPGLTWTRNDTAGAWIFNHTLTAFRQNRASDATTTTVDRDLASDAVVLDQREVATVREHRQGLHASGRLQWRGDEQGHGVVVTPILVYGNGTSHRTGVLEQTVGSVPAPYDRSATDGDGSYSLARVNLQWNRRVFDAARIEARAGYGLTRTATAALRREETGGALSRTLDDRVDTRDRSATASTKLIAQMGESHSVVAGAEFEANRRRDRRTTLQDGLPLLVDFGDQAEAASTRWAVYAQDEWNVTPAWAAHAGLRWEGIGTRGSGELGQPDPTNRSSVWTPLLHAVWKPEPQSRDQVRISLTRSYRSPTLGNLIARPSINTRYAAPGPNTPTQPDRAGNPGLKPELATGIDVAIERYLPGSGLLSANVFHRRIRNFMRSETALETVPWASVPRYVSRVQNVGDATTDGLELEAKFRLADVFDGAPRTDVRANASVFRSRVRDVPGPDNRIDQQPDGTLNLGADHRFTGVPMTLGVNLNWTPGYTTRISNVQTASIGRKLVVDAYGLWMFNPALALRVSFSNLDPREYVTGGTVDGPGITGVDVRETSQTRAPTSVNVQVRVEMKL